MRFLYVLSNEISGRAGLLHSFLDTVSIGISLFCQVYRVSTIPWMLLCLCAIPSKAVIGHVANWYYGAHDSVQVRHFQF